MKKSWVKHSISTSTGAEPTPQLAWVLAQAQLLTSTFFVASLAVTKPLVFPADIGVQSAGNTFPADFDKDFRG